MRRPRRIALVGGEGGLDVELAALLGEAHDAVLLSMVDRRPSSSVRTVSAGGSTEPGERRRTPGWQPVDWFHLRDAEQALRGFDAAIYLERPLLADVRLLQGPSRAVHRFCADNFARAARSAQIGLAIDLATTGAALDRALERLDAPFDEGSVRLALAEWAIGLSLRSRDAEPGPLHLHGLVERVTDWGELRHRVERVERARGRVVIRGAQKTSALPPASVPADATPGQRVRADRSLVRSVQELPVPRGRDATWIANEYLLWLDAGASFPARTERTSHGGARIRAPMTGGLLLELEPVPAQCSADRHVFAVTAGMLTRSRRDGSAQFEFRLALDGEGALCALVDFTPRLPWPLYRTTQAVLHARTMARFAAHLRPPS